MLVPLHEHRPRAAGHPAHVHHPRRIGHRDDCARQPRAPAQIQVFGVQPVALVETAQLFIQRSRHQHQRTGHRLYRLQRLAVIGRDRHGRRGAAAAQQGEQHAAEIRITPPRRRVTHAVFIHQVRTQQHAGRYGITGAAICLPRQGQHSGQCPRLQHQVRIDHGHPVAVLGTGRGHALVAGHTKAGVVGIGNEAHPRVGGRMPLHDRHGAVRRVVVDHPDGGHTFGPAQAPQALVDGRGALVGHHHCNDPAGNALPVLAHAHASDSAVPAASSAWANSSCCCAGTSSPASAACS